MHMRHACCVVDRDAANMAISVLHSSSRTRRRSIWTSRCLWRCVRMHPTLPPSASDVMLLTPCLLAAGWPARPAGRRVRTAGRRRLCTAAGRRVWPAGRHGWRHAPAGWHGRHGQHGEHGRHGRHGRHGPARCVTACRSCAVCNSFVQSSVAAAVATWHALRVLRTLLELHGAGGHKGGVNFSDGIQASDVMGLMGKGGSGACYVKKALT